MIRDGKAYSILTDQLGTPTEAYDSEGNEVWSRVLDMDGNVIEETGNRGMIPFLFQGQYYDSETELAYNRFRYYDPKTGAYISQDPIGLAGGILNLYGYVNDTNAWIDVFGLSPFKPKDKLEIISENIDHYGTCKCEKCKQNVIKAQKSRKGVTPPRNEIQIDHIEPESLGGKNSVENGQVLCRRCNRQKSNKSNINYKKKNRDGRKKNTSYQKD